MKKDREREETRGKKAAAATRRLIIVTTINDMGTKIHTHTQTHEPPSISTFSAYRTQQTPQTERERNQFSVHTIHTQILSGSLVRFRSRIADFNVFIRSISFCVSAPRASPFQFIPGINFSVIPSSLLFCL